MKIVNAIVFDKEVTCTQCAGTGKVGGKTCSKCGGSGKIYILED